MKLKTEVYVNLDLHFTSDDLANGAELARLAAVCDGLYMLIRAQRQEDVFQETSVAQLATQVRQMDALVIPAAPSAEVEPTPQPTQPPVSARKRRAARRPQKEQPTSRHWSFEEYDRRVRAEMERLATDGIIPSHSCWDREKSPELPTLQAVIFRYRCKNTDELAAKLGLLPRGAVPTSAPAPANDKHEPRRSL